MIKKTKLKHNQVNITTKSKKSEEPMEKPTIAIPYVKGLFEKLKHACNDNLIVVGKAGNTLKKSVFSKLKDATPLMLLSYVVYEVTCECGYKYIGHTEQLLKQRMYQHKYNISIGNSSHSALCEHAIEHKHNPRFDEVKVLHHEYVKKKREVLEMISIKRAPNAINKQTDSAMLSSTYSNLIQNDRVNRTLN